MPVERFAVERPPITIFKMQAKAPWVTGSKRTDMCGLVPEEGRERELRALYETRGGFWRSGLSVRMKDFSRLPDLIYIVPLGYKNDALTTFCEEKLPERGGPSKTA